MYTCDRCHACSTALEAVTSAFDDALEVVRRAAVGNAPFRCADIEGTVAERDVGRDRMEREAAALARGDAAFDALSEEWDGLEVEEPHRLEARLAGGVRAARRTPTGPTRRGTLRADAVAEGAPERITDARPNSRRVCTS